MAKIFLTKGHVALIDDEDFEALSRFNWIAHISTGRGRVRIYAVRSARLSDGARKLFLMHREIMGHPVGLDIDHINHDCLDNRRSNLRTASRSQNIANQARCRARFGFRGVCKIKRFFYGSVTLDGKQRWTKGFETAEGAARARDLLASECFGEFAVLNFPKSGEGSVPAPLRTQSVNPGSLSVHTGETA